MHTIRESWLLDATERLRPLLSGAGLAVPKKVKLSCGFPGGGSRKKRLGETWVEATQVFVSPITSDENGKQGVLSILLHELVHACLPPDMGHKGAFKRAAAAVGLEGNAKCTTASQELQDGLFKRIVKEIGPYPHKALVLKDGSKTQTTRLLKLECPGCGLTVRITRKWLDAMSEQAVDIKCWLCDSSMEEA